MTYKPDSGDNINFNIESYNPPLYNELELISSEKYYVVPNADEVTLNLEQYSLKNTDFEFNSTVEGDSSSEGSPETDYYYQIPAGNVVDFKLEFYEDINPNLVFDVLETEVITNYYSPPKGYNVNFSLEEYQEISNDFDITPDRENELITNDLEVSINSTSSGKLFIDTAIKLCADSKNGFEIKADYGIEKLKVSAKSKVRIIALYENELYIPITSYSSGKIKITETIAPKFNDVSKVTAKMDETLKFNIHSNTAFTNNISLGILLGTIEGFSNLNIKLSTHSINEVLMVLSPDFELLAYLEDYSDFVWNRRWRKVDDFELSINYEMKNAKYLRLGNYIAKKKGDVIHAGRIGSRNLKNEGGTQQLQVSGKGLGEIFETRIAFHNVNTGDGYDTFSGPAESAIIHYINNNVINPEEESRAVSRLRLQKDNQKGAIINYKARFQKISEIIYEIAKTTGLGWDIQLDLETKDFVFKILKAKMRTGVRLNPNFDSVKMLNFKENKSELENTIMVAGQGEGSDRIVRTVSRNEVD